MSTLKLVDNTASHSDHEELLALEWKDIRDQIKTLQKREKELKEHFAAYDQDEIRFESIAIKRKVINQNRFDTKSFKADFEDIYDDYCKSISVTKYEMI